MRPPPSSDFFFARLAVQNFINVRNVPRLEKRAKPLTLKTLDLQSAKICGFSANICVLGPLCHLSSVPCFGGCLQGGCKF